MAGTLLRWYPTSCPEALVDAWQPTALIAGAFLDPQTLWLLGGMLDLNNSRALSS